MLASLVLRTRQKSLQLRDAICRLTISSDHRLFRAMNTTRSIEPRKIKKTNHCVEEPSRCTSERLGGWAVGGSASCANAATGFEVDGDPWVMWGLPYPVAITEASATTSVTASRWSAMASPIWSQKIIITSASPQLY